MGNGGGVNMRVSNCDKPLVYDYDHHSCSSFSVAKPSFIIILKLEIVAASHEWQQTVVATIAVVVKADNATD